MKLVYLSNSTIPSRKANSIHVMKMSSAFSGVFDEVHLITADRNDPEADPSDLFRFYSVEPSFGIHRVHWFKSMPGKYFIYAWMSARKAIKLGADVIYGRYLFGVYAAERMGQTVVFESHSDEFNRSRLHRKMIQTLVDSPRCKKIVVISHALKKAYTEEYPAIEKKIIVAHDGADHAPVLRGKKSKEKFIVGYIGHLYKGKGMEIISQLVPRCPEVHFRIVGGLENDIKFWKEKLKKFKNIEFTGFVPHAETPGYLAEMDIVLAPYLSKVFAGSTKGIETGRWMSPLKVFEYMCAGKPVIASDLPVIREVLCHQKNALLCDPGRPDEWVKAIRYLKEHPAEAKRLAGEARNSFEEKYSWQKRAEILREQIQ
ncbi:MAG: glycosyltransferase family 4 protein [Balneolaceae bacterium]